MAMALNDVVQLTFWSRLFNQQLMTVLHYRVGVAQTATTEDHVTLEAWLQDFADITKEPFASMIAATSLSVDWERVTLQKVKPTRSIYVAKTVTVPGEWATVAETANVCGSVTKRSTNSSRRGVGHVQWPPLAANQMENGVLEGAFYAGEFDDMAVGLSFAPTVGTGTQEATLVPCLPAGGSNTTFDVFSTVPQRTVRTMHRRTVGLGI